MNKEFLRHLSPDFTLELSCIRSEIWLRLEEEQGTLTLFATSVGPLSNPDLRKRETLANSSASISSVKAYLYGKPIVQDHTDLGSDQDSTRWQSFISVPIFLNTHVEIGGKKRLLTIRPGVVTENANLKESFNRLGKKRKDTVLRAIIGYGQKICAHILDN